jgi:UrcA family protein
MQRTRFLAPVVGTLIALGAGFGGLAAAEPVGNARSIAIEYGDLELGSGLAIERLYARISAAAERVCGDFDGRNLRERNDWQACYEAALADAVARVPHAALAERHRSERERRGIEARGAPVG